MTIPTQIIMKKKVVLLVLSILILSWLPATLSATTTGNLTITYQRFESLYYVGGLMGEGGDSPTSLLMNSSIYYYVSNATYTSQYTGEDVQIQGSSTLYKLTVGSMREFQGNVTVSLTPDGRLTVMTQIPQLIRLIVNTSGMTELVWAGLLSGNGTIQTSAYVNGTGTLTLVFSNGTSLANISLPLKTGSFSYHETLTLNTVSARVIATFTRDVEVQQNFPRRYENEDEQVTFGNTTLAKQAGYNTTMAYFNGSLVPALVWKGEGRGLMQLGIRMLEVTGESYFQFETIEFFGVNGSAIGYVHSAYLSKENSRNGLFSSSLSSLAAGELKIVTGSFTPPKPEVETEVEIKGTPVMIIITNNASAESTANVNLSHPVFVQEHGKGHGAYLVEVSVNGTAQFFVVTPSGHVINVTVVKPENVSETTVNMSGNQYPAQKIVVNANGSILFNVTLLRNENVMVFKVVNGTMVPLNSTNYFVVNGRLVVYDDPSNVYYAVYGVSSSSTSSSTTSSTTPPSSGASSTSTSSVVYIGIGIVIVVIVALAIFLLRKR
ncbi:hypothetical protein MetMK1DRAFT_00025490 [Metallosphaera yellowstonensis MK1]|jgi:hypothetical protein|uniref:Thermopsin n=2 Tax=Metallosphaera TaxID=41980 RepID=H2C7K0_9CREN|nr:hypothetical protein MetMK1DRAFT_00025490 [Metallosphaera yellowstonensis MK1]